MKGPTKRPLQFEVTRKVVIKEVVKVKEPVVERKKESPKQREKTTSSKESPPGEQDVTEEPSETIVIERIIKKKVKIYVNKSAVIEAAKHSLRGRVGGGNNTSIPADSFLR